jgi:hypothetical protein
MKGVGVLLRGHEINSMKNNQEIEKNSIDTSDGWVSSDDGWYFAPDGFAQGTNYLTDEFVLFARKSRRRWDILEYLKYFFEKKD